MQTGVNYAALSMQGVRFFQSAIAVAMPQLQGLGDSTTVYQRSIRLGVATQFTVDVRIRRFTLNTAIMVAACLLVSL